MTPGGRRAAGQPGQRAARGSSRSSNSTVLLCPVPALLVTPCCQPMAPALLPSLEPTASLLCGVTVPWKPGGCEAVSASRDAVLCEPSRPGWGKEMSFSLMLPKLVLPRGSCRQGCRTLSYSERALYGCVLRKTPPALPTRPRDAGLPAGPYLTPQLPPEPSHPSAPHHHQDKHLQLLAPI